MLWSPGGEVAIQAGILMATAALSSISTHRPSRRHNVSTFSSGSLAQARFGSPVGARPLPLRSGQMYSMGLLIHRHAFCGLKASVTRRPRQADRPRCRRVRTAARGSPTLTTSGGGRGSWQSERQMRPSRWATISSIACGTSASRRPSSAAYVGRCISDAINEITQLRKLLALAGATVYSAFPNRRGEG